MNKYLIINKTVKELAPLVDAGHTIYAHTGKQGTITIYRRGPGQYGYHFEHMRIDFGWHSERAETLSSFLESIDFTSDNEEYVQEMKELLTQPVWSILEERSYRDSLYERGLSEEP